MQRAPLHFVQRRVENLDLADDHHYSVTVTQQFVPPRHAEASSAPEECELLVPLGEFSKDRMPDLQVAASDGSTLPLLSRSERGWVGANLFSAEWAKVFYEGLPANDLAGAEEIWGKAWVMIAEAITGSKVQAEVRLELLKRNLEQWTSDPRYSPNLQLATVRMLSNEEFWIDLYALAETRLLMAKLRGFPGRAYTVTVRYTERFAYRGYAKTSFSHLVRRGLAWLGLISLPIVRPVANIGQAASLWIVQSVPEGVEAVRCYWKRELHSNAVPEPVSVEVSRAVAAKHMAPGEDPEKDFLFLDVQISPSTALVATIGLAILLLFVATYVYQAIPAAEGATHPAGDTILVGFNTAAGGPSDTDRSLLVGLGSIFAAIPAAITGALAYRGETFVRRISRGPRTLLALLSVQAAFFAVVISLKDLGDLAEGTAYVLSIYSLAIIGIFGFIQLGPRWRKNALSRKKSATVQISPVECRKKQIRDAVVLLASWTIVVIVFARCQKVLQHDHFFTADFPRNVWDAWWSWFW
jgi:hypothetical protein